MAYGGDSQAEYDYGEEEYDYDDAYEEKSTTPSLCSCSLAQGGRVSSMQALLLSRRRGLMLGRLSYRHTAGS